MATAKDVILKAAKLCRENGIEPNRIRVDMAALKLLDEETGYSLPDRFARPDSSWLDGFEIVFVPEPPSIFCEPGFIVVDRKPEEEGA